MSFNSQKRLIIVIILLVVTKWAGLYAVTVDASGKSPIHSLELPDAVGSWKGKAVKVDPVVYEVLHPDAVVQMHYKLTGKSAVVGSDAKHRVPPAEVDTIVIYSRDVRGFHSPDLCLTTQGWVITDTQQKPMKSGNDDITLTVLHAEREKGQAGEAYLAYFFADAQKQVRGWVPILSKLVGARLMRRRVGAVQIQFAYDRRAVQPDQEFKPELSELMLAVTNKVQSALEEQKKNEQNGAGR